MAITIAPSPIINQQILRAFDTKLEASAAKQVIRSYYEDAGVIISGGGTPSTDEWSYIIISSLIDSAALSTTKVVGQIKSAPITTSPLPTNDQMKEIVLFLRASDVKNACINRNRMWETWYTAPVSTPLPPDRSFFAEIDQMVIKDTSLDEIFAVFDVVYSESETQNKNFLDYNKKIRQQASVEILNTNIFVDIMSETHAKNYVEWLKNSGFVTAYMTKTQNSMIPYRVYPYK